MWLNWKVEILVFLTALMLVSTPFFGRVETKRFSAYAVCRKAAKATKSVAVWKHGRTIERTLRSEIIFSDGFSTLDCHSMGVGPFWMVRKSSLTWHVCDQDLGDGKTAACPEEYFGVSP